MKLIFLLFCLMMFCTCEEHIQGFQRVAYLSDCPGSIVPIEISKQNLTDFTINVLVDNNILILTKTTYSFYQMKQLAKDPAVDFSRPTVLYLGSSLSISDSIISRMMEKSYSDLGYNVLSLGRLEMLSNNRKYPIAVRYSRTIGKYVAEMLVKLVKNGLDVKKLEIVGLSLGAQTMSFIAKNFYNITGTKISKLIGLDPSGPCFRNLGPNDRLTSSDADFVLVVHSNIDGYGMAIPMGHVDFYINGGEFQPADLHETSCDAFCSHIRAFIIWLISLKNPNSFIGIQCDSVQRARNRECYDSKPFVTNTLGPSTNKSKQGKFYLSTHFRYPYYLGKKGLKREHDYFINTVNAYLNTII